jgi:Capsular polysaccharide synthesis protein
MTIPHIIWALWLDFNNTQTRPDLSDVMLYINRIKQLHPHEKGWTVKIITEWDELVELTCASPMLGRLLENKFVGAAHKSDAIRMYLLKTHGGIWVDLSTFLVSPLDDIIAREHSFICFYASQLDAREWFFANLSEVYEHLGYLDRLTSWTAAEENFISLKDPRFNFIPENYFICSSVNHEIISHIYSQLERFWNDTLSLIDEAEGTEGKKTLCFYQSLYVSKLIRDIFDVNILNFEMLDKLDLFQTYNPVAVKNLDSIISSCGYLFNYLQMYLAIKTYCEKNDFVRMNYISFDKPDAKAFSELCTGRTDCDDIEIQFGDVAKNILLMSATYNRAGKWSNNQSDRFTWENSYLLEKLNSVKNQEEADRLIEELKRFNFHQFKFGSYSRSANNKAIPLLQQWYGPSKIEGGKKKQKKHTHRMYKWTKKPKPSKKARKTKLKKEDSAR